METDKSKTEKKFGWYTVKVLAGAEQNIVHNIKLNYESAGIADDFEEIYYPFMVIESIKKAKEKHKTLYPGYIFIKMNYNDKSRDAVLSVSRVYAFVATGQRGTKPRMLSDKEYSRMISKITESLSINLESQAFALGDAVEIKSGSFNGFKGSIIHIDSEKSLLKISISVFKRETEVIVPFNEVEKVNNSNQ